MQWEIVGGNPGGGRLEHTLFPSTTNVTLSVVCWWHPTQWKWCRNIISNKNLVVKPVWYEGLGWGQLHHWDQDLVRLKKKKKDTKFILNYLQS